MSQFNKNPELIYCYENPQHCKNYITYSVKSVYGKGNVILYDIIDGLYLVLSDVQINNGLNDENIVFFDNLFIVHHCISGNAFVHLENDLSAFIQEGETLFYTGDDKYLSSGTGAKGIVTISLFGYRDLVTKYLSNMYMLDDDLTEHMSFFKDTNEIFVCKTDEEVIKILNRILDAIEKNNLFKIKHDTISLLFLDAELYPRYRKSKKIMHKKSQVQMIESAVKYMKDNFDSPITIEDICSHCGMNKTLFKRIFPKLYGITPINFLRDFRLEKGKELLESGVSVLETANMVGYQNPSKFSIAFKKKYGVLPSKI